MSQVYFGNEIIEIKNHTAAMMQVISTIRRESNARFEQMEKYLETVLKTNADLNRKNEEVMKSNVELISLNKVDFQCAALSQSDSCYRHLWGNILKIFSRQCWIE